MHNFTGYQTLDTSKKPQLDFLINDKNSPKQNQRQRSYTQSSASKLNQEKPQPDNTIENRKPWGAGGHNFTKVKSMIMPDYEPSP